MGKIYDGEVKLNVVQVCDVLCNKMPESHRVLLASNLRNYQYGDKKMAFAHATLDSYKFMPADSEQEIESKKMCKHLMEKYMKSNSTMESESSAFNSLCNFILK